MGCGCGGNKNKAAGAAAKPTAAPAVLWEVVNDKGTVAYRTREKRVAQQRANSNAGWHYRRGGTTTPITD